ncbi:unnamed protein product [Porites evermanni]|uniref:Uncharacterized protein n=1 Tax=Porites evermanni TaxID=104178 RepID=A0ABN8LKK2_9CNID|nr:unnamed protein product [Porites evermanni]
MSLFAHESKSKMKVALLLFLFSLTAATFGFKITEEHLKEKRFFYESCTKDLDCGPDRCCLNPNYFGFCARKRGLNQSCNFVGFTRCFCKDGLSCQTVKKWRWGTTTLAWNRCRPIPTEQPAVGSGSMEY